VLFYVAGDFTSRTGVASGSLTWHPRGTPHGPQPGRYEASIGKASTDEVAVMLDCQRPLSATRFATAVEDPAYAASFDD
jgi:homogentisate 1,2-dioxygenase